MPTKSHLLIGFRTYGDYLSSPLWKRVKTAALGAAGGKCVVCSAAATTVHHRRYDVETLRGNDPSGLVALCRGCHNRVEYGPGYRKRTMNEVNALIDRMLAGGVPAAETT